MEENSIDETYEEFKTSFPLTSDVLDSLENSELDEELRGGILLASVFIETLTTDSKVDRAVKGLFLGAVNVICAKGVGNE